MTEFAEKHGPAVPNFNAEFGFKCITYAYPGNRYNSHAPKGTSKVGAAVSASQVVRAEVQAIARDLDAARPRCLVALELEHWKVVSSGPHDDAEVDANIAKLAEIVEIMHDESPALRIGYYSLLPVRNFWAPYLHDSYPANAHYADLFEKWKRDNARLAPVAEKVDVIFPSLYTFYDMQDAWEIYAKENIKEAKKYGRPVIPYIWPRFHTSNKTLGNTPISGEFWGRQLGTLAEQKVDGIVFWDFAYDYSNKTKLYWNKPDWWTATLHFLFK